MPTWSRDQDAALRVIEQFFRDASKQVCAIDGAAGTGKTAILAEIAGNDNGMAVACPTAKSAMVLRQRGIARAQTIHSLIYVPVAHITGCCALCERKFADGDSAFIGELRGQTVRYACASCRSKLVDVRSWRTDGPKFIRRPAVDARRIAIEEGSMVGRRLGADLLSYGLPILVVGDSFQLPPIHDAPTFFDTRADATLSQIHRQAAESPVIAIADVVRLGGALECGQYGASRIVRRADIGELAEADQTICGTNRSRVSLNRKIRQVLGFDSELPESGDKVICLRNDYDHGLLNGSQWSVTSATTTREPNAVSDTVKMNLSPLDDPSASAVRVATPSDFFTKTEASLPWFQRKALHEFTFASAITAHKSQGSEWTHVAVVNESGFFREHARRWLYTCVTRARERLTLVT